MRKRTLINKLKSAYNTIYTLEWKAASRCENCVIVNKLEVEYKYSDILEKEIRGLREGLIKIRDMAYSHNGDRWKAIESASIASEYLEKKYDK